jgi:predicted O-methyltransferase YrrM
VATRERTLSALVQRVLRGRRAGSRTAADRMPVDAVPGGERSLAFARRAEDRYWWHRLPNSDFIPPLYAVLSDDEWAVMDAWFKDTDARVMHGEANVSALSVLQGFIMGSLVRNVVQLGAYAGYSTLLVGFMMRRMGFRHSVVSIDVVPEICAYCEDWIRRAGLEDYVRMECSDSSAAHLPDLARRYFGEGIALVFIDSSHQYAHTVRELDLWVPSVLPGGFLVLHDASDGAVAYDQTGEGGVHRAFREWAERNPSFPAISINRNLRPLPPTPIYKDACGLAIIQRPG